jgi:hypothetical protein
MRYNEEISEIRGLIRNINGISDFKFPELTLDKVDEAYKANMLLLPPYGSVYNTAKILKEHFNKDKVLPLDKVKEELIRDFGLLPWQIIIREEMNHVEICVIIANDFDNASTIKDAMDVYGYFSSSEGPYNAYGKEWYVAKYEPKYQEKENEYIRRKYKYLYHLTPIFNVESIMEKGLVPNHRERSIFEYPDRIYLLKGDTPIGYIKAFANELYRNHNRKDEFAVITCLLIDVGKIPVNVDFYFDPNEEYGIFTDEAIPSESIVGMEDICVKSCR